MDYSSGNIQMVSILLQVKGPMNLQVLKRPSCKLRTKLPSLVSLGIHAGTWICIVVGS